MIGEVGFFELIDVLFLFFGFVELVESFVFEDIEAEIDRFDDFVCEDAEFLHGFFSEFVFRCVDLSGIFGDVFGMVADALDIGDGKRHLSDAVSLVTGHVECTNFDESLRDRMCEEIDGIFVVFDFLSELEILVKEAFDRKLEVFACESPHARDFSLGLLERDSGGKVAFLHVYEFAVFGFPCFFGEFRKDLFGEFDEYGRERAEDENRDDREYRVRVCDLASDVVGRKRDDEIEERRDSDNE